MAEQKTIRVRIAVAVLPSGAWNSCGGGTPKSKQSDEEMRKWAVDGLPADGELVSFVEADVPMPSVATIQGEVQQESAR